MKKFFILASLPYILILTGFLTFVAVVIPPATYMATGSLADVCFNNIALNKKNDGFDFLFEEMNLEDCILQNSDRYKNFKNAYKREPLKKTKSIPNDKGGCDLDTLESFVYKDKDFDKRTRQSWIAACKDPYASYFKKWADTGGVNLGELKKTGLQAKYETFNWLIVFLGALPSLLLIYLVGRYKDFILPRKEESVIAWLDSQKNFRVALLVSLFAFIVPTIILITQITPIFTNTRQGLEIDYPSILLLILFLYPLVTILAARFIVTSKD